MKDFLLVFIPLFVAIDPIGTLPLFLGLTQGFSTTEKRRLALQAVFTALVVGLLFGFGGHYIFMLLGITSSDFQIAGGLLLLIFSVREIFGQTSKITDGTSRDLLVGIVPLGIPLIAGPAMITTVLILFDHYTFALILLALLTNLLITAALYIFSDGIVRCLGEAVSRVSAKIIAIFLAAIGIMMIRRGLEAIFHF